jgi:hypothetical protein
LSPDENIQLLPGKRQAPQHLPNFSQSIPERTAGDFAHRQFVLLRATIAAG